MEELILQTDRLTKRYKTVSAVDNVSLTVHKGDIYGFVGMNGSGKTTFIRMITSLIKPSAGNYRLFGDLGTRPHALRRISSMVETPSIYMNLCARDCLRVQAQIAGVESRKAEQTVTSLLELVGLSQTGQKPAKQFSLGMRQRLGIATALVGDPEFMLLDEPTNGLDPGGIIEIRELLQKLNREREITILISSHILAELGKLATRYGFIHRGQLLREESAADIRSACQKRLVLTVSHAGNGAAALEAQGFSYLSADGQTLTYPDGLTVSQAFRILDKAGVGLIDAQTMVDDLETYFMKLVGGAHYEAR